MKDDINEMNKIYQDHINELENKKIQEEIESKKQNDIIFNYIKDNWTVKNQEDYIKEANNYLHDEILEPELHETYEEFIENQRK